MTDDTTRAAAGAAVDVLHEHELTMTNGRRFAMTTIWDASGSRTVLGIESRTGMTMMWGEITPEQLVTLCREIAAATVAVDRAVDAEAAENGSGGAE